MNDPTQHEAAAGEMLIGIVAVLGAATAAGASWAMLGYWLAWKLQLSLGMILPPLVSGCFAGLTIRFGGQGVFGRRVGEVAVACVLVGCIVGDLVWIKLANQKSFAVLLGPELRQTLNTMFDFMKALMYAAASYLAYAISIPQKPYVSE
jgi:hypothetical protein